MAKPQAAVVLRRKGRYVDEDEVLVQAEQGAPYAAALAALRKAKIEPFLHGLGALRMTFDPEEIEAEVAVDVVKSALRSAGIRVLRL